MLLFILCVKVKFLKISIIIPVYREYNINKYIAQILNDNTLGDYEIIVVDGDGDSTIKEIKIPNITLLTSKKGRANQINEGVKNTTSKVLLFLHADTTLPQNALRLISEALDEKGIVAGAFDLSFDTDKKSLQFIAYCASKRSRLTRLPYGDQAIFIKKDIFEKIGGYSKMMLMEDINLMQKLKISNYKIKILNQKVITSPRKWEKSGVVYTTLRNLILSSLYYLGVNPDKLAKYYK